MFAPFARLISDLAALIYPVRCLLCDGWQGSKLTPLLCENCLARLAARPLPAINAVKNERSGRDDENGLDAAFAGWQYDASLQGIIHKTKYYHRPSLGGVFGSMLAQRIYASLANDISQAVLVPVPLHPRRERDRGFNQSLVLARAIAAKWHLDVLPRALRRVRFTESQATLDAKARVENVKDAFAPAPKLALQTRTIFLVDDVLTTGATMNACAAVLKSMGAHKVIGIALATVGHRT